jgi:hypothetical protein
MTMLWLVTLIFRLGFRHLERTGNEVQIAQRGHHLGMHGRGLRSWLCGWVRKQKFGNGSQRGFTILSDVWNRGSTRMLVAE